MSAAGGQHWEIEFYDFAAAWPAGLGEHAPGFGDLHERAVGNGARSGTPVIVARTGEVDSRVNLFFRTGRMADCTPATWRRYGFALVVWLNFLHVFGQRWDQATARDVEAFKHWRLTDLGNAGRVAPTSFDTDRAALKAFYTWSAARYGTVNPVCAVAGAGFSHGR